MKKLIEQDVYDIHFPQNAIKDPQIVLSNTISTNDKVVTSMRLEAWISSEEFCQESMIHIKSMIDEMYDGKIKSLKITIGIEVENFPDK